MNSCDNSTFIHVLYTIRNRYGYLCYQKKNQIFFLSICIFRIIQFPGISYDSDFLIIGNCSEPQWFINRSLLMNGFKFQNIDLMSEICVKKKCVKTFCCKTEDRRHKTCSVHLSHIPIYVLYTNEVIDICS